MYLVVHQWCNGAVCALVKVMVRGPILIYIVSNILQPISSLTGLFGKIEGHELKNIYPTPNLIWS